MKTLEFIKGQYGFEHRGMFITNPILSECFRFCVNPSEYGFEVCPTGGGHDLHYQCFMLDGKRVMMILSDGDGNQVADNDVMAYVSIYSAAESSEPLDILEIYDTNTIANYEVQR
jgi:hypothetical protein